jgi:RNA polymerase sigma factor (TIGR02999 family)
MIDVAHIPPAIERGDREAAARLLPLVYDELRRPLAQELAGEPPGQTLHPTTPVHDAYLRPVGDGAAQGWSGRGHFFAAAATAMRRLLVERARRKGRQILGGDHRRREFHHDIAVSTRPDEDLLALDAAAAKLAECDPVNARLVEVRYFAGLTARDTAAVLGISARTVDRHWAYARAWFRRELEGATPLETIEDRPGVETDDLSH